MSSAWIQVEERREQQVVGGVVTYTASFDVRQAYAVPPQLFVLRADDGTFSHVATTDELLAYPTDRTEAQRKGFVFWRDSRSALTASTPTGLAAMIGHVRYRLQVVTQDWPTEGALTVPGSDVYTLGAEP